MPTRTRPTREQTRAQILKAAGEVFTDRGYDGASLDQVAAAAGLTKGAVYSSFAGKDELFFALVGDRLDQRLAAVGERSVGEAADDLAALFSSQRDWHLLFVESWARAMRDPERRARWMQQRREARAVIAAFFERRGARAPEELAVISMALSNGLAMEHIADPDSVDTGLFARTLEALS